ncbi:hypothetical protein J5Y03_15960 [Bacillus sp. RG28]|uniref:Uncharacterized protein n=1 Tax=Gottfriedia endophytica TaxID=2820819 RepID=A0A940NJW0_9BACI|nr:hypothetical protein [Gottfriedia endophytica]MBP0726654.1 hypothetical protein [Gottfriedia endophytica]
MVDINPELLKLSTDLTKLIGKTSVQVIIDKIKLARTKENKDEAISNLEEIITELIAEKNQLIQIAQAYDEQLITQKLSNQDIEYITTSIVPLVNEILNYSDGEEAQKAKVAINMIKPILSKETFNILQLLGFNFKQAIGEPLTYLVRSIISSKTPVSPEKNLEFHILSEKKQIEYFKVLQDDDAFQRHQTSFRNS